MLRYLLRSSLAFCSIFGVVRAIDNHQNVLRQEYLKQHHDIDVTIREQPAHTHVFKESIPMLSSRSDLQKRSRVHHDYIHEVIFFIRPKNINELTRVLHDVSNPTSLNYGQHWTKQEVSDFTSNPDARDAVVSYLHSNGASVVSETLNGEYITANARIAVWEDMFDTEFFIFHQTIHEKSPRVEKIVRTEKYSIPMQLDPHVEYVFNTIDVLIQSSGSSPKIQPLPEQKSKSKFNALGEGATFAPLGSITPYRIKSYYNMSNDARGNNYSTQGVFSTNNRYYSDQDLLYFQQFFELPQRPVAVSIGDHMNHTKCLINYGNCAEPNLDLNWIMSMSPLSPTTNYYTGLHFLYWLIELANTVKPALVYSISYGGSELGYPASYRSAFTTYAIKLGTMGVTIFTASGDDGANNYRGGGSCGYSPEFPSTSPYVTAVGATSVSLTFLIATLFAIKKMRKCIVLNL